MARIRYLKPDFFKDEDLAELPYEARILFEGLWCCADKKGRLEDRPKYLKAEIFPYDKIDMEKLLNLLAFPNIPDKPAKVFIRRYSIKGRQYIDIPEFLEYQTPHHTEKKSMIPSFNDEITVKEPLSTGLKEKEKEKDTLSGKPDPLSEIIDFLNTTLKTNYKPTTPKTRTLILARIKEGFTIENFKTVIENKYIEWGGDDKMKKFLRPETLFGTKFEGYLNAPAKVELV
ncbi:MAG: conserved phage C-terminal domain-containing protein [Endomicrobiia bacterium]|nr:conserved phage C-terminal domain-containing protein [Endomicrobiia bacterium]